MPRLRNWGISKCVMKHIRCCPKGQHRPFVDLFFVVSQQAAKSLKLMWRSIIPIPRAATERSEAFR